MYEYETVMGWVLIVIALCLMTWTGFQAIAGRNAAYHRIVALCLVIGLNLNTTENVTGDLLSEFGVYMLLAGLFCGGVLAVFDAYSFLSKLQKKTAPNKKPLGHELKQS